MITEQLTRTRKISKLLEYSYRATTECHDGHARHELQLLLVLGLHNMGFWFDTHHTASLES